MKKIVILITIVYVCIAAGLFFILKGMEISNWYVFEIVILVAYIALLIIMAYFKSRSRGRYEEARNVRSITSYYKKPSDEIKQAIYNAARQKTMSKNCRKRRNDSIFCAYEGDCTEKKNTRI